MKPEQIFTVLLTLFTHHQHLIYFYHKESIINSTSQSEDLNENQAPISHIHNMENQLKYCPNCHLPTATCQLPELPFKKKKSPEICLPKMYIFGDLRAAKLRTDKMKEMSNRSLVNEAPFSGIYSLHCTTINCFADSWTRWKKISSRT